MTRKRIPIQLCLELIHIKTQPLIPPTVEYHVTEYYNKQRPQSEKHHWQMTTCNIGQPLTSVDNAFVVCFFYILLQTVDRDGETLFYERIARKLAADIFILNETIGK